MIHPEDENLLSTSAKTVYAASILACVCIMFFAAYHAGYAQAQSKPHKPPTISSGPVTIATVFTSKSVTWEDWITKDGHYVATFDDPNNEFRCDVVSYLDASARNVIHSDITSLTIVCTKKREPKHK